MGRPAVEEANTPIHHFSHPHPLEKSYHQPQFDIAPFSCSCCRKRISGWIYHCNPCNFFLHLHCFERPKEINHSFHHGHVLTLLPNPAYGSKSFACDACGTTGEGFSYHCKLCSFDIHACCAAMPLKYQTPHHLHQLNLCVEVPYENGGIFECDICKATGVKWLYRCDACEFDAHLNCIVTQQAPASAPASVQLPSQTTRIQVRDITHPSSGVMMASPFTPLLGQVSPAGVPISFVNPARPSRVLFSHPNVLTQPNFAPMVAPAMATATPVAYVATPQMLPVQPQVGYLPTSAPRPNTNLGAAGIDRGPSLTNVAVQGLISGVCEGIGQNLVGSLVSGLGDAGGGEGGGTAYTATE